MKKLKTAVSGLGRIGWQFHIPSIVAHDGFELAAACDPLEERRKEARETFGVENAYADFIEMLEAEKPDLVVVCSPTPFHEEQAVCAMERGCDVFLDKPMAPDLAATDRIIEAKKRTGRKLMMYQPHRIAGVQVALREILESKILGEVYMFKSRNSAFVFRNDWQAFKKYGGGMLNNFGAHAIDAALYLSGGAAKRVCGHMYKIASAGDADDVVKVLIETDNGVTLDIEINMANALPESESKMTVYGSRGTAQLVEDESGSYYLAKYFDLKDLPEVILNDVLAAADRKYINNGPKSYKEQKFPLKGRDLKYYDFCYDYYALDKKPFVELSETREVMRVMHECRVSAGW